MSGQWTRLWDAERGIWVDVWIDLPIPLVIGRGSAVNGAARPILLGPDGRPVRSKPLRRIGFGQ